MAMSTREQLPCTWVDETNKVEQEQVDQLKIVIENLKKEKERLEEADELVKKSIEIVAEKRLLAQQRKQDNLYIFVTSELIPTQEELKEAGLEGWEWVTVY